MQFGVHSRQGLADDRVKLWWTYPSSLGVYPRQGLADDRVKP